MRTYLFYDIETTGLNLCFDQVIEFAAIRTDLSLNEIERHHYTVQLRPDVVVSPMATLTHRLAPTQLQSGLTEAQAIHRIHQLFNTPGTISCGYNTLGFDDGVLRFAFYRHMLDPYSHQYANGCGRADLYPITILYYLYANDGLKWPMTERGVSLKLERINKENQLITDGQAHHAMTDVEVTLALARLFFRRQKIWDYAMGYFNKSLDNERIERVRNLRNEQEDGAPRELGISELMIAVLIHGKYGVKQRFQSVAVYLGRHKVYKNQGIWLRLDQSPIEPNQLAEDDALDHLIVRKKSAEPPMILPLDKALSTLSEAQIQCFEHNRPLLVSSVLDRLATIYCHWTYPDIESIDPDANLYQSHFLTDQERLEVTHFHQGTISEKLACLTRFEGHRMHPFMLRYIWRFHPTECPQEWVNDYKDYMARIWCLESTAQQIDYRGGKKRTVAMALDEMKQCQLLDLDDEQMKLMAQLQQIYKEGITAYGSIKDKD